MTALSLDLPSYSPNFGIAEAIWGWVCQGATTNLLRVHVLRCGGSRAKRPSTGRDIGRKSVPLPDEILHPANVDVISAVV